MRHLILSRIRKFVYRQALDYCFAYWSCSA